MTIKYRIQIGQPGMSRVYNPLIPLPKPILLDSALRVTDKTDAPEVGDKLIGFQKGGIQNIIITSKEFEAVPERAVGLVPVFSNGQSFYNLDAVVTHCWVKPL